MFWVIWLLNVNRVFFLPNLDNLPKFTKLSSFLHSSLSHPSSFPCPASQLLPVLSLVEKESKGTKEINQVKGLLEINQDCKGMF